MLLFMHTYICASFYFATIVPSDSHWWQLFNAHPYIVYMVYHINMSLSNEGVHTDMYQILFRCTCPVLTIFSTPATCRISCQLIVSRCCRSRSLSPPPPLPLFPLSVTCCLHLYISTCACLGLCIDSCVCVHA